MDEGSLAPEAKGVDDRDLQNSLSIAAVFSFSWIPSTDVEQEKNLSRVVSGSESAGESSLWTTVDPMIFTISGVGTFTPGSSNTSSSSSKRVDDTDSSKGFD